MGSTMIEENVVRNAGANFRMNAQEIETLVAEMGYVAKKRDFFYNILN
jgi:cyclic dehypoxanthinyl futalosine synthase